MTVMLNGYPVRQTTAFGGYCEQNNYVNPRNPNKPLFMSYKIHEFTQMLDRLKLPSAAAGGPGDCRVWSATPRTGRMTL